MLELRGATDGELLDEPWRVVARGAGGGPLTWRARIRDDDGRVWRAEASSPQGLAGAWAPAKRPAPGPVAALRSLRPVAVDLRAETADGRGTGRSVTRRLVAEGVRSRRWRDGVTATLHLPAGEPAGVAVLDGGDPGVAPLAAALLASRGVLVLQVADGLEAARERLAGVPAAAGAGEPRVVAGDGLLPPGIPAEAPGDAEAWDALLSDLGAVPRQAVGR
jgi:hypothetical protein